MKKKTKITEMWKRGMSVALTCAMTVSMLPAFSLSASAAETELLKAGSIPASESTLTYDQPTAAGTAGSTNFRIPAFISLDNGENRGNLVAAADARYTVTGDGGGLDTIASVSEDMGKTWNYSFPIYYPDSNGYDGRNATTAIDPVLVEAKDGTIYCLADMNPTGITTAFGQVNQGTGYVEIGGKDRLVLTSNYANANTRPTAADTTTYEYYIGDFDDNGYAPVLKRSDNTASGYGVDEWYNLYHVNNGNYVADLTQHQTNSSSTTIQQNAFYKDSALHVYNTGYIMMVKSTDGGWTWGDPVILNPQIKRPDGEYALLVSPGKGTTLKNGTIIIPFYDHGDSQENVSFIYSKDNGATWKRTNDVSGGWTSESELVELEDGTLRMFSRNGTGKICYADTTMNEDGDYVMGSLVQTNVAVCSTCNVTASMYSKKINGKEAILVACPSGSGRANGKIYTFLVNDDADQTMELYASYAIPDEGYGTGYGYSCLDEQTDGSIGLYYEPNGSPQRCIYTSIDMADITGGKVETKVEISADTPYVETYNKVADTGNITQQPDSEIATVTVEHNTVSYSGSDLYAYKTEKANSLDTFDSVPETGKTLADCEFTITSKATDTYTVQSVKTQKYWNTNQQASYFGDTATDLKIVPTTANGQTTFRVCLSSGSRYVVFYPTKMYFDAYGAYSASATNVDFELAFFEKKEAAAEGDLLPGYQRATAITSGKTYLIGCMYENNFVVLYPENTQTKHTKLVRLGTYNKTTLTITKGTKSGVTTAVVDGKTYKILADAEYMKLGKGSTTTFAIGEDETFTAGEGLTAVKNEITAKELLYDHSGSNGFATTANDSLSLSAAEMEFTKVGDTGNTFTVKAKNNWYLGNAAASGGFWQQAAKNLDFNPVDGEAGAYEIVTNGTTRYMCFYNPEKNFNAMGSKATLDGSYSLLVLEKKDAAAADDVIPGYQKATALTSGKSYLIAYKAADGSVYVLYPVAQASGTDIKNQQTKKYEKQSGSQLTVTGTAVGQHELTVGDALYIINVVCLHKNIKVEGAQEATCEATGLTGKITCTECNEVLSENVTVAKKGHWYGKGVVTKAPTVSETGVMTYTCGLDATHTKTAEIPRLSADRAELAEKIAEAAEELAKTDVYTAESLAALQTAYNAAAAVTDSTSDSEVASRLTALKGALENLQTPVQKAEEDLQNSVATAEPINAEGSEAYTADTWTAFEAAYQAAKNPPANATKDQLDELKANLDSAIGALQRRNPALENAQADRQAALAAAKTVYEAGQGSYTTVTWTAFKEAYDALNAAADITDATELAKLTAALTDAQSKLAKEQPGGTTNPDPSNPNPTPVNPTPVNPTPVNPTPVVIEQNKIYDSGNYYYKVTSVAEKTAQVTGLKKKDITKIVIYNTVTLGGQKFNVTSVAPSAFKGNKKITSVTVKKGILDIGANAFASCSKLKKVTVKSTTLKSIGAKAFYNCKNLKSIVIKSKALKKVGKNAFKGINKKAVIKVPKAKAKAYKKLLAKKGQSKTVKIK